MVGRPPEVSEEASTKIRKELSENQSGWVAKEVMNLIYERTGVKYHKVHIYRLLHKWGFNPKVPRMKFINAASKQEKNKILKKAKRIISRIPHGPVTIWCIMYRWTTVLSSV